mmetsp:Transcript_8668/g.30752  ORF Transcript_8668/g.30752 Transcript_8668/m.30752 type:complete len:205 (-) Transcript_8668:309-923(-)
MVMVMLASCSNWLKPPERLDASFVSTELAFMFTWFQLAKTSTNLSTMRSWPYCGWQPAAGQPSGSSWHASRFWSPDVRSSEKVMRYDLRQLTSRSALMLTVTSGMAWLGSALSALPMFVMAVSLSHTFSMRCVFHVSPYESVNLSARSCTSTSPSGARSLSTPRSSPAGVMRPPAVCRPNSSSRRWICVLSVLHTVRGSSPYGQ